MGCSLKLNKINNNISWSDSNINNEDNIYYTLKMEKQLSFENITFIDNVPYAIA